MKRAEIILASLALLAAIMKMFHILGAEELIIISLVPLAFMYFYLGVFLFNKIPLKSIFTKGSFKGIPRAHIVIGAVTGVALSIYIISFLFAILLMPGAHFMANLALGFILLSLVLTVINSARERSPFYRGILIRLAVVVAVMVIQITH